jgi:dTDP-4-dehydrorhamnose reductase
MRIVIIGSTGQLGTDLKETLQATDEVIGLKHQDIEVTDYNSCLKLKEHRPDIIINTAAFHKTDQCEDEPLKALSVNAIGARNVALVSKEINATTVYIGTDYVFDGTKTEAYNEEDKPNPINTYGISKLAGEFFTKQNPKHYITRIASLFGVAGASGKGGNFVETMITKAKKNEPISVVNDMWMSPTYTKDAATAIQRIMKQNATYGTYHITNQGLCTWFEFTKEIFNQTHQTPSLTAMKTDQQQYRARRPKFSALTSAKLSKHGIKMPEWKDALHRYLIEKKYIKTF